MVADALDPHVVVTLVMVAYAVVVGSLSATIRGGKVTRLASSAVIVARELPGFPAIFGSYAHQRVGAGIEEPSAVSIE
jgi:hypothetical protein